MAKLCCTKSCQKSIGVIGFSLAVLYDDVRCHLKVPVGGGIVIGFAKPVNFSFVKVMLTTIVRLNIKSFENEAGRIYNLF